MFDHRREHPFYGICRRTGCELDHAVAKGFCLLTHTGVGLGNGAGRVSFRPPPPLPDIGRSSGGSDASRVDTSVRGDIVDFAARSTDIHELPVT